jgi:hypothetical protein
VVVGQMKQQQEPGGARLLSAFAIAGLKVLLARGFGWRVVH